MAVKRNIGVAILLTVLTGGLYGIYWFIKITDEAGYLSGDESTSGLMAFLFIIITCGIYKFFWSYKIGKTMYQVYDRYDRVPSDNSVLFLILSFLQLDIITYAIVQSELNDLV